MARCTFWRPAQDGRLVGIIPLYLTGMPGNYTLQVVGCVEVSDYLDLLVECGQEEAVYAAFLTGWPGRTRPNWDCLELCNQPAASQTHERLPALAAHTAGPSRWRTRTSVPSLICRYLGRLSRDPGQEAAP